MKFHEKFGHTKGVNRGR